MTLQQRLEKIIRETHCTYAQLGKWAGVTKGAVSQWMQGDTKQIKPQYAVSLEEKTGFRALWILFGTGDERVDPRIARVTSLMLEMTDAQRDQLLVTAEAWVAAANNQTPPLPSRVIDPPTAVRAKRTAPPTKSLRRA